ncbi:MAG: ATP-binding protein, partial [Polyangiaceae bacterium]
RTRESGELAYFVRDDGVGFDTSYASRICQPFQRFHTTSEFEGTGIGLAIVERIIRHHDGRIWVESEPDSGATFFFTLRAG